MNRIDDALDGMTARDVERLIEAAQRRLRLCAVCGSDGAEAYRVSRGGITASLLLCPACFAKHRLPESRAEP